MVWIMPKKSTNQRLYLVSGDDEATIAATAEALFTRLAGEKPDEFSVEVLHEDDRGPRAELVRQVISALRSPPFLGGCKTVWLKHFTGFGAEAGARGGDPLALQELVAFLETPLPEDMQLLLDGPDCDARKALAKVCAKNGEVIWCNKPNLSRRNWREEMAACLQRAAEQKGIALTMEVREALTDALGANTGLIDGELEKLICHAGGPDKPITVADVQLLCPSFSDQPGWALGDPIGKRNLPEALSVLERLLAREKDGNAMARSQLNQLGRLLITWLHLRLLMAEQKARGSMEIKAFFDGLSQEKRREWRAAGAPLADFNGWRAKFAADSALNYTPAELMAGISAVRDALLSTTTTGVPPVVALENALAAIVPRRR